MVHTAIPAELWDHNAGTSYGVWLVLRIDDEDEQDGDRIDARIIDCEPDTRWSLDFNRADIFRALRYPDTERAQIDIDMEPVEVVPADGMLAAYRRLRSQVLWRDHSESGCNVCGARAFDYQSMVHGKDCALLALAEWTRCDA